MKAYYDLHIHSCLSPCGDKDMTPYNIAGMAKLCGLDTIALTDHNSCKNCPAFLQAAQQYGLCGVAGMELCTSEEIHVVCLFPTLAQAMRFDSYVYAHIMDIQNREDIYGAQIILDEQDQPAGREEKLLLTATDISISGLRTLVDTFGGVCLPAHIDRDSYSVLASLGEIPPEEAYTCVEITEKGDISALQAQHTRLTDMILLKNSDAHYLENIAAKAAWLELPERSPAALVSALKNGSIHWGR